MSRPKASPLACLWLIVFAGTFLWGSYEEQGPDAMLAAGAFFIIIGAVARSFRDLPNEDIDGPAA